MRNCEDGDLEIDNNGAERSLRGVVVGRKNWLFYGSDNGGRTGGILSSLIACGILALLTPIRSILMIERLRITVLADDYVTGRNMLVDHGLSVLIEADNRRILFDTGQGRVLRGNAEALGAGLSDLDAVVLSHGHYDHTGGLAGLLGEYSPSAIFVHSAALQPKYAKSDKPLRPARAGGDAHPTFTGERGARETSCARARESPRLNAWPPSKPKSSP